MCARSVCDSCRGCIHGCRKKRFRRRERAPNFVSPLSSSFSVHHHRVAVWDRFLFSCSFSRGARNKRIRYEFASPLLSVFLFFWNCSRSLVPFVLPCSPTRGQRVANFSFNTIAPFSLSLPPSRHRRCCSWHCSRSTERFDRLRRWFAERNRMIRRSDVNKRLSPFSDSHCNFLFEPLWASSPIIFVSGTRRARRMTPLEILVISRGQDLSYRSDLRGEIDTSRVPLLKGNRLEHVRVYLVTPRIFRNAEYMQSSSFVSRYYTLAWKWQSFRSQFLQLSFHGFNAHLSGPRGQWRLASRRWTFPSGVQVFRGLPRVTSRLRPRSVLSFLSNWNLETNFIAFESITRIPRGRNVVLHEFSEPPSSSTSPNPSLPKIRSRICIDRQSCHQTTTIKWTLWTTCPTTPQPSPEIFGADFQIVFEYVQPSCLLELEEAVFLTNAVPNFPPFLWRRLSPRIRGVKSFIGGFKAYGVHSRPIAQETRTSDS